MHENLKQLKADLIGAGLDPGRAGGQLYLKAQTISAAMMITVLVSLGAAGFFFPHSNLLSWTHAANAVLFLAAYLMFRRKPNPKLITRLCCLSAFGVMTVVNVVSGGVMSPAISWFVLPALASALILSWREGWVWIGLGCLSVVLIYVAGHFHLLPQRQLPGALAATAELVYALTFALVIGLLFSFWVARQSELQARLRESLARSKADTETARLFAESAAAANGSMDFASAGGLCLELVCNALSWRAGHIWHVTPEGLLASTGTQYRSPSSPGRKSPDLAWPGTCPDDLTARIAQATGDPIIGLDLAPDPRFSDPGIDLPVCVLAWPVAVDGVFEVVLEFFSDRPIELNDELRVMLNHVAAQVGHVRLRENMREKTESMAFTDPVTGLPNRNGFEHLFEQKLRESKRAESRMALMFVDLDGFKRVNDSLGHAVGDSLLERIGRRLRQHVRGSDVAAKLGTKEGAIAARLGGDEFTLVATGVKDATAVAAVARRFLDIIAEPVDIGFQEVNIGASIGIAMYPDDGKNLSDLMRLADAAMYEAKSLPGNQFRFATPALNDAIQRRLWIETELHRAIEQDDLRIRFAPVAAALSGRIIGNEVFLRWPHRDGEIAFTEFFGIAESSGLAAEVGYWTIEKACAALARLRWGGGESLTMSLDISLRLLQQPNFVESVGEILARYDIPKAGLEFEFSDTSAILQNEACREHIRALHAMGIRIVLDHFGTGYSSLLDLSQLPIWRIKLDREFVETVNLADGNRSMGRAIVAMAHSMGIETTIFGVDTAEQAAWLRELGCDALQGGWIGHPRDEPCRQIPQSRPPVLVNPSTGTTA